MGGTFVAIDSAFSQSSMEIDYVKVNNQIRKFKRIVKGRFFWRLLINTNKTNEILF
jgi:hypothetical protein